MRNSLNSLITFLLLNFLLSCTTSPGVDPEPVTEEDRILMILAPDNVYYTEYIIAYEGLKSLGYEVDLVSVKDQDVSLYMLPAGTTVEEAANSLPGNNKFNEFKAQFQNLFGTNWNQSLNVMPNKISDVKSIFSIDNMDNYQGIVIPGGTGIINLRTDGTYEAQAGIPSIDIQRAAEKLNELANEALLSGKPILAQCHGASLPVFWQIEATTTPLMLGQQAAGYPDPSTESTYQIRGVTLRANDKVIVSSPNIALTNSTNGDSKIITSRDWYPQTVAYAIKVFTNILQTYPDATTRKTPKKVLILHGGTVNEANCVATNRANDIPCNYGVGINLPADFSHIKTLLLASSNDGYQFQVSDLNITNAILPYTANEQSSIENYFKNFDAVIFFKHWSTGVNTALQNALISYTDNGGGVLALHHALYNDVDDANTGLNKNILTTQLFGGTSEEQDWFAQRTDYQLYSTNYGHFVSTFHVPHTITMEAPANWAVNPVLTGSNISLSLYPVISIFDEIYANKRFVTSTVFGNQVNEITPLFSNNLGGQQAHTEGYVRLFNKNNDDKTGRVACFQAGESRSSFGADNAYAQIIRNAVVWITN
jgi:putative intracellular protease/amidase